MVRLLAGLLMTLVLLAGPAAAGNVRLVIMDGVNLEHLDDARLVNIKILLEQGAIGLANANTAGGRSGANSAVTIGAGSRALGPQAEIVLHRDDLFESSFAGDVLARRTGISPPPGSLVLPSIALVINANEALHHRVQVGYLADSLAAGGRTAAVLANADGEELSRAAAAIIAKGNGIVNGGHVGRDLLTQQQLWPFGVQSDLDQFSHWLRQLRNIDLVVIDLGDTGRAQDYSVLALEGVGETFRLNALLQLDLLVGLLLEEHQEGDLLLMAGLQADGLLGEEEAKWLVPVIAYGQGFEPGLLTSPTTRRRGLVASFDITATILQHFELYRRGEIHGQPLNWVGQEAPLGYLLNREAEMAQIYLLRTPLVKGYIGVIIIMVGLAVAALLLKWQRLEMLRLMLAAVAASPLILLLLGVIPGSIWMVPVWITLALGAALVLKRFEPITAMRTLGAVTALIVAFDALLGAWLQQRSILGYDAIAGARYYGIGNEYMGVLVGCTLLAVSGLLSKRKLPAAIVFAAVILLLMLPGVGANLGGTLAAILGFTVALVGSSPLTNQKHRRLAVLAGIIILGALVLFNLTGEQSHVGRFFTAVVADPAEFWLAVQRKLAMSWRLVRWSLWSRAFAALFVAALWLLLTNRRLMAQRLGEHWPGVRGAMAAALAALLLNDSGVVAAATTLLYLTLPLLYYEFSSSSLVSESHSP